MSTEHDRSGMPALGLGTWQNDDPAQCVESVRTAIETGYRHVDTARMYRNEAAVGEGIARADVDSGEVFVATKLWIDELAPEDVRIAAEESRKRLGVDAIDLLYVHWPAGSYDPETTLPAFEALSEAGTIERIGVANFEPEHLEAAQAAIDAPVFANQVEMHPFLPQQELREYCAAEAIELVAYSPLARGAAFESDVLGSIAADHGISEAQVSLAWLREKGVAAIPKATGADHIRENWASLDVALTDAEIERIDAIGHERRLIDPGFGPDW